jgi:hypothetical protein
MTKPKFTKDQKVRHVYLGWTSPILEVLNGNENDPILYRIRNGIYKEHRLEAVEEPKPKKVKVRIKEWEVTDDNDEKIGLVYRDFHISESKFFSYRYNTGVCMAYDSLAEAVEHIQLTRGE